MNDAAILNAIDEALNNDDGSDDEGLVTLVACLLGLRMPAETCPA